MIGRRLLHYEIVEKLGEGGMGVVYKARDTHLDRFVAIKVLPPEKVADEERKRRFIQEAKAASALNHPNILHIYDIGQEAGVDFIAMEYVDGKTVGQLIGRKGLKLGDVLKYSVQIASGLAKAHEAGIVHRDLKPANVMVSNDGIVKVLDFGLAKLTEPAAYDAGAPTLTVPPHTEEGMIVGTAAYMSPEQAEGRPVDGRSDIFSFGSVLYEMVTGRRAFQAETKLATLSAILRQEPALVSTLAEETPPELEKLIHRCLRKDPERRVQHMSDVKLALEDLKEESESGKLLPPPRERRRRAFPLLMGALALVLLGAPAIVVWMMRQPAPAPVLTQLTSDAGLTTDPALSPDGKLLAYASDRGGEGNLDIWVRQVAGGEPVRLTQDPAHDREPSFSPDGTMVVFRSGREGGGLYAVSALGGPARKIAAEGQRPRFSPDGSQIAYWTGGISSGASFSTRNFNRIFVVPASGGAPRQVRSDFVGAAYPEWTPDGKHLLFLGNRDNKLPALEAIDWWVTPLGDGPAIATGALRATHNQGFRGPFTVYPWALITPVWHPEGDALIFSARQGDSRNLWHTGISPRTWQVSGAPRRLTSGTAIEGGPAIAAGPEGSLRVTFASLSENSDIWSMPLDANAARATGEPKRLTTDTALDFYPSLSPDGSKMVYVSGRAGGQDIWIRDLKSGAESAVTASRTDKYNPHFSPDSLRVSFATHQDLKWDVYVASAAGGAAELICEDCGQATGWSPDGRYLMGNDVNGRLTLIDVAARRRVDLLALPERWFAGGRFSPDGRWIAFLDAPRWKEFIAPFKGEALPPESEWTAVEAELNAWSPDGRVVYGWSPRDGFGCVWAQRLDPATKRPAGAPVPILHAHGRQELGNGLFPRRDLIVFSLTERFGNIWMAEFRR